MPAAAVIPAPRAYIRVVAVKTCVVEAEGCRMLRARRLSAGLTAVVPLFARSSTAPYPSGAVAFPSWGGWRATYLEQMSALEVGRLLPGSISME